MSIIEKALDKSQDRNPQGSARPPGNKDEVKKSSPEIPEIKEETVKQAVQEKEPIPASREPGRKFFNIDWPNLKDKGMLVPELATSQLAEEYRVIKRPLLMNAFPDKDNGIERANLILVTSSVPGEGKTFTAMNLALSIAMERDKTVLLIDADVAKPSIAGILGAPNDLGLIDMLKNPDLKFSDVLIQTDTPSFSLMTAGKQDRHSTELLASDAMKKLTREWSAENPDRIIIFDSPPLLAATQGPVLASLVGQVVLVVESDRTPQYVVQESLSKLESCDVVGCVLNKTNKGLGFNYYGYFYGYGYGYGRYGQQQKAQD